MYSIIDIVTSKILCMELVQSTETGSANKMECEGLKRCYKTMKNFKVLALVTDMHLQIAKWVRENWSISHFYDCWHVVKSITKKLEKLGKQKEMAIVSDWIKSIKLHLYWCALSSTPGQSNEIKEKWLSCIDHIQNVHTNCYHQPYEKKKNWLIPGSRPADSVKTLLTSTRTVNKIMKMSPYGQTSDLESFHSLVNHFAPKMIHFSYKGMISRVYTAILHWNENSKRPQARKWKTGELQYSIYYPKYKDGYVVHKILQDATYSYIDQIVSQVFATAKVGPRKLVKNVIQVPPSLSANHNRIAKSAAIAAHKSRFRSTEKVPLRINSSTPTAVRGRGKKRNCSGQRKDKN
ncbi:uncharacterized protein LOC141898974 [Tubulanus polymorphus]|uniref:uncharacterized protein LOC141898974 n=1 Tax=Tubulanus polymorphus TaxID=672921 RepID=UPI003DA28D34